MRHPAALPPPGARRFRGALCAGRLRPLAGVAPRGRVVILLLAPPGHAALVPGTALILGQGIPTPAPGPQ
eukprot:11234100-Alexandrium_andersonii.AAC.1